MNKIIMGILLVAIIAAGAYFLTKKPSQPATNQSPAQISVGPNTIVIKNFAFDPAVLTVKQGTTVTWVNQDSTVHRIKSDTFNSQDLNQGDTFQFAFNTVGSFDYTCGIHPSMQGKIVVE